MFSSFSHISFNEFTFCMYKSVTDRVTGGHYYSFLDYLKIIFLLLILSAVPIPAMTFWYKKNLSNILVKH